MSGRNTLPPSTSMTSRYSLRFESGERRGETIPITSERFTIGRQPGSSLQIQHPSVSGRHVELTAQDGVLRLKDLGSTNGTKVDGERVEEASLAHGTRITVGSVELVLHDTRLAGATGATGATSGRGGALAAGAAASGAPASGRAGQAAGDEAQIEVSAADLARARRGSKLGIVVLVLVAAGAGAAWWWSRSAGSGGGGASLRPVEPVAGNLLGAGYSFEEDERAWTAVEGAPVAFVATAGARWSGGQGLGVELEAGEWAAEESPSVAVRPGTRLVARGRLRAAGEARLRLGIELSSAGAEAAGGPRPVAGWSAPLADGAFEEVEVSVPVPSGYDRARVVLRAEVPGEAGSEAGGTADADDVALLSEPGGEAAASAEDTRFFVLGTPPASGVVHRVDRVLLSGLRLLGADGQWRELAPRPHALGLALPTARAAVLELHVEARGLESGGLATAGPGGYQTHSSGFEREGVSHLVLGSGIDLVRLSFDAPVLVRAEPREGGFDGEVELGEASELVLQTRFQEERAQALRLAGLARDAERRGGLGECLALWQELLDTVPFDVQHVRQAEEARGRLLREGLAAVDEALAEVERARFFRLADLYRQCRERAEALAITYAGSDVEEAARRVVAGVDEELAVLEAELVAHEKERLRAIHAGLEARGAERLAGEVARYLDERFGSDL